MVRVVRARSVRSRLRRSRAVRAVRTTSATRAGARATNATISPLGCVERRRPECLGERRDQRDRHLDRDVATRPPAGTRSAPAGGRGCAGSGSRRRARPGRTRGSCTRASARARRPGLDQHDDERRDGAEAAGDRDPRRGPAVSSGRPCLPRRAAHQVRLGVLALERDRGRDVDEQLHPQDLDRSSGWPKPPSVAMRM